jgi:hypothetical protein
MTMKKSLVLLLVGALAGGMVVTVLPAGAHHQPGMGQLRQDVNRLQRMVTNRTQHLTRRGVYRGPVPAYQVISECPDQTNAVWRLQAERARSISGLEECRQQRPRDLWNREFDAVTATEGGQPRPFVPDSHVGLRFERQRELAIWTGGCNLMGAKVNITPAQLFLIGQVSGTAVGCRDELHEQDDWLTEFMRSDPFWEFERRVVTGDRLTLTSGDTVIELVARD